MKITFIFSCSGMFRNVPGFIDALDSHDYRLWAGWEKGKRK